MDCGLREGKAFSQIEVKRGNEEEAVRLISEALAEMYEQMNQEE